MGMKFNFLSPLATSKVSNKYMGVGNGESKTCLLPVVLSYLDKRNEWEKSE